MILAPDIIIQIYLLTYAPLNVLLHLLVLSSTGNIKIVHMQCKDSVGYKHFSKQLGHGKPSHHHHHHLVKSYVYLQPEMF